MEPVIKVRYKWASIWLTVHLAALCGPVGGNPYPKCDKSPEGTTAPKTEGTNGFAITIVGTPRLYRPHQVYTISLQNVGEEKEFSKFQGFVLVTEPTYEVPADSIINLGSFQLMPGDAMVKFSHRCSDAVEATSSISKEEVQVYWKAPPAGSGCIDFKAMIEERKDVWYEDVDTLTYELCEDDSPLTKTPVVTPCCACDEAKYEAIFEGIWSRHTHPKDFPPDEWRTEFSQIIGASHSMNYSLWEYGRPASPALALLGEKGLTGRLEQGMKRASAHIRSVIKAQGLQQRSNLVGQTFAVFRVDPTNHLVSLVSKMIPSPDWIVGLSKENLCKLDCSWVPSRVIDLYPWDIGTQKGDRYDSPDMPARPRKPIMRITSSNPNNPDSPFFDETSAPMKPVARLHLIQQRQYHKDCPPGRQRPKLASTWSNAMGPMARPQGNTGLGMGIGGRGGGGGGFATYPEESSYPQSGFYDYNEGSSMVPTAGYDQYGTESYYGQGIGGQPFEPETLDYETGTERNSYSYGDNVGSAYDSNYNQNYGSTDDGGYYGGRGPNDDYNDYGRNNAMEEDSGGFSFWGSSSSKDNEDQNDACALTEWGQWGECSATCGMASRNRMREYIDKIAARIEGCKERLLDKERCRGLPKCQSMSFDSSNSFDPFTIDDQAEDNINDWRGLQTGDLVQGPKSYLHESGKSSYPTIPNYERQRNRGGQYRPYANDDASNNRLGNSYMWGDETPDGMPDIPRYSELNQEWQGDSAEDCSLSDWGEWSHCSMSCGYGIRTRTRRYENPNYSQDCTEELDDQESCHGQSEDCPSSNVVQPTGNLYDWRRGGTNYVTNSDTYSRGSQSPNCQVAEWSEWSPCSKKCEIGYKQRTRLFRIPFVPNRSCDVQLIERETCVGGEIESCHGRTDVGLAADIYLAAFRDELEEELDEYNLNGNADDNYDLLDDLEDDQWGEQPYETGQSSWQGFAEDQNFEEREDYFCKIEPDVGPCKGHHLRWHYDPKSETCKEFFFRGCNGNKNNFPTKEKCMEVCGKKFGKINWKVEDTADDPFGSLKALSSIKVKPGNDIWSKPEEAAVKVDCQVTAWSEWSPCSQSCGWGWKTKSRDVMTTPSNGGKPCPKKTTRRRRCRQEVICPPEPEFWYMGSWRHMVSNDDTRPED